MFFRQVYFYPGRGLCIFAGNRKTGDMKRNGRRENNEVKVVPPVLQGVEAGGEALADLLAREDEVDYRSFSREVVEGVNLPELNVSTCVFDHVAFPGCRFRESRLTDVLFENCDLSNVDLSGCVLFRVEFRSCKLMGTNLSDAVLNNVLFHHCNARYVNLSMGRLKQVFFAHGDMQGGALESCRFESVAFDTCSLVEAEFSRTPLKGIDLTSSKLEGIRLGVADLRGVIVSPLQALDLSRYLGLVVKDV